MNEEYLKKYKEMLDSGMITKEEYQAKKEQLQGKTRENGENHRKKSNPFEDFQIPKSEGKLDARTTGIVGYFSFAGFVIAYLLGDREGAKFHLNQALVIHLFSLLSTIHILGSLWLIFMIAVWAMGFSYALSQKEIEVPLIGKIKILK